MAGLPILLAGCVHQATVEAALPDAVTRLAKTDPNSPAALQARLEYADSLVQQGGSDCLQRLYDAQVQLDAVAASPALSIVLPLGPARLAGIEYEAHAARASCLSDARTRESELRAALAAAERSVTLYRDALDYASMAIMQFNVGFTERALGHPDAAIAALQSAIRMDQEYGLRDDAEDNERTLASWTGQVPVAQRAEHAVPPPPARSVSLTFAWHDCDAKVHIEVSLRALVNGQLAHTSATRTAVRHIVPYLYPSPEGWLVSYERSPIAAGAVTGATQPDLMESLAIPLTQALLELPEMQVDAHGELQRLLDTSGLVTRLQRTAQSLVLEHSPAGSRLSWRLRRRLREGLSAGVLAEQVGEAYSLETAAWIGSTFEQGEWYQSSAMLALPGMAQEGAVSNVEMAYTRDVDCEPGATGRHCVEIVVHATPVTAALRDLRSQLIDDYWSSTDVRVVVDPGTLLPYVQDTRRHWYIVRSSHDRESVAERTLVTFTYPPA